MRKGVGGGAIMECLSVCMYVYLPTSVTLKVFGVGEKKRNNNDNHIIFRTMSLLTLERIRVCILILVLIYMSVYSKPSINVKIFSCYR